MRPANPVIMHARKLRKGFDGQEVLKDISFDLHAGECVALVGENGSGKSTLENILTGHLEPDSGYLEIATKSGAKEFNFPRKFWQRLNPLDLFVADRLARHGILKTWQDARLFAEHTLLENIAISAPDQRGENPFWSIFSPAKTHQEQVSITKLASTIIEQVGLTSSADTLGSAASLGMAKRLNIARAVNAGAKVLFLDEPFAGCDSAGIAAIQQLLSVLQREQGITLVIVEHAFNFQHLRPLVTRVWQLKDGRLHDELPADWHEIPSMIETVKEWLPGSLESSRQELPGGAALTRYCGKATGTTPALEVSNLVVFRGQHLILGRDRGTSDIEGLSFTLRRGEIGFLEAPNGWGKSTTVAAISGLVPAADGCIRLAGEEIDKLDASGRAKRGLRLLRSPAACWPSLTVQQFLRLVGAHQAKDRLSNLLNRHIGSLSGGEKQRVALAALLGDAETAVVLLLDEPCSNLSMENAKAFLAPLLALEMVSVLICLPRFTASTDSSNDHSS